ncbi:putative ATP-binding cassette transporter [Aspergillus coremiiformis]|uniref:Putative ATP-binding cassette transporter n=1 Tax=Aspergillus coremiiformis TaxID=138285 RepID=A0A5N6Z985_9EURO|nr:putative ATP-binding cassette transporter [Aspergillus coremiiformis]
MEPTSLSSNCSLDADEVFGPVVNYACRNGFDFTLLFEQSMLGILPAAAFLLVSPLRVGYLTKKDAYVRHNSMRLIKITLILAFSAVQLALLVCWARHALPPTKASLPLASINLIVALELLVLSWMEDGRSARPSSLLNAYLLLTLLFDIVQARTLWLRHPQNILSPVLFTVNVGLKAMLLLLESIEKRRYLLDKYQDLPPESTSGIISRSFMWWLNHLFVAGSRCLLTVDDLHGLDKSLSSARVAKKAQCAWSQRRNPPRRFEFPLKMCQALWKPLFLAIFPRICLIGFTFAQPFLIASILNWLNDVQSPRASSTGRGLIGATVLVYLGIAISTLHHNHLLYRFITMFRGAASSLIYQHMLQIPDGGFEDRLAAITLMTTDIDRISACLVDLNECWARAIEVAVGIAILTHSLGWVSVMPVILVIISVCGSTYISRSIGYRQRLWVDAVQQRLTLISSMLTEIQTLRQMGLGQTFVQIIQNKRVNEIQQMASYRWSIVWQNVIQNLPWALAPALTFTAFAAQGHSLDVIKAFSSLSMITLLTNPAAKLLSAIPSTAASLGCFDRIQCFLLISVDDNRHDTQVYTAEKSASRVWSKASALEPIPLSTTTPKATKSFSVVLDNVSIRPATNANVILSNVNLKVPWGELVIIRGAVGSGKSTLLRAILGQIVSETGAIQLATQSLAYCAQTSWLPNTTIRNVICGIFLTDIESSPEIDDEWYRTVLHACDLDRDVHMLPGGDGTFIGGGSSCTLSGGQMHRVALARAVYARKDLVLLDDVLGALDSSSKSLVLERLFGKQGLLRKLNSTVILVTHEAASLPYAIKVFVISDGTLKQDEGGNQMSPGLINCTSRDMGASSKDAVPLPNEKAAQVSKANQLSDLKRSTGDYKLYGYYFRSVGWVNSLLFLLFVIANVFCSTFSQIWLEKWVSHGGGHNSLHIAIYFVLATLEITCMGGYVWTILILISPSTARKLHYVVLKTIMRAAPSKLATMDSGTVLNRLSQDMTLIESQLPVGVLITVSNFFIAIAATALIATGTNYMAITVPFLIVAVFLVQHFYLRTSRQLRLLDLESKSPLYSHYLDTVHGISTIQAFGWERKFLEKNSRLLDISQKPYYLLYCIQRWLALVLDLIVAAEAVLVVSLAVSLKASTSVGLLGVSFNNILSFSSSLSSVITGWTQLEISLGSIARVRNFEMEIPPEETSEASHIPIHWPDRGSIKFHKITAQYNSSAVILKDVSFNVQPGEKVGICGRTGSGKSSLLGTLLGMLNIKSGSILVDNVDLAHVSRETVREQFVAISQEPLILLGCTVRVSADPTGRHSDTEIIHALDRVGIWKGALEERGGLDGEVATRFSRGQNQLFALARAMLKLEGSRTKVLLLDEATSNIDPETDARIQAILRQEPFRSCSILTVAHRINTIEDYDVVIVLDRGRVARVTSAKRRETRLLFMNSFLTIASRTSRPLV